jgi:hypothetical protein
MAGSFADYLELKLLDLVFGAVAFTAPTPIFVGLSTTTITDAGANITEPSGNAYARVSVTNNATNWPAASAGSKSNGVAFTFPAATGAWGTITDFFISDASSGGNILAYGVLTTAKAINNGDTASFAIGDITITLN